MNPSATVHSNDAVRDFRAALQDFCEETRAALVDVDLELRRSLEWLLEEQPAYWRNEVRKANDAVVQAKVELHRARMKTLPGGGTPSCMEERKAVDRAERQLRYSEEKVEIVREWGRVQQLEVNEYAGRASQLTGALDVTVPRATRFLDQSIGHLESYVAIGGAAGAERGQASMPTASTKSDATQEKASPANPNVAIDRKILPGESVAEPSP